MKLVKKLSTLKDGERLYIEWIDAWNSTGWKTREDASNNANKPAECEHMGFFFELKPHAICITMGRAKVDTTVCDIMEIPYGCLKKVYRLE